MCDLHLSEILRIQSVKNSMVGRQVRCTAKNTQDNSHNTRFQTSVEKSL